MSAGSQLLGDAYVNIMGETSKLEQSLGKAYNLVHSTVTNLGKTLAVGIGGAAATALGTAVASMWMWAKEEQSVVNLDASIKMLGGDVDKLVPRYEEVANAIQQNTTIADDATRSAMAYAASLGAPVDRLDDLAIAAAGLSARLNMSMTSAMMILTRSLKSGRFDIFTRYGLTIDKTKTKQEQFNQVMEFANKGFEKQVALTNTISGRLTQLKNNFGDVMEDLGKKISEKFMFKEIVDELSKRMYKIRQAIDKLWPDFGPATVNLTAIGDAFERLAKRFLLILRLIPEIAKGIKNLFSSWGNTKEFFVTMFKELGIMFAKILVAAAKGLVGVFTGLGNALGRGVEQHLLKIPIIRENVADPYLRKIAERQVEKRLTPIFPFIQDREERREAVAERLKSPEYKKEFDKMVEDSVTNARAIIERGGPNAERILRNVRKEMLKTSLDGIKEGLKEAAESAAEFKKEVGEAVGVAMRNIRDTTVALSTDPMAAVKDALKIKTSVGGIVGAVIDPESSFHKDKTGPRRPESWFGPIIDKAIDEINDAFATAKATVPKPEPGKEPFKVGGKDADRTQITGVKEFWTMMQKSQEDEPLLVEAKKQVEITQKQVEQLVIANTNIGGLVDAVTRWANMPPVSVFNPTGS